MWPAFVRSPRGESWNCHRSTPAGLYDEGVDHVLQNKSRRPKV